MPLQVLAFQLQNQSNMMVYYSQEYFTQQFCKTLWQGFEEHIL